MKDKEFANTGTTTVGIVCKDGIVLAADKRVTAGYIANKHFKKISFITDDLAVTMAGLVSDAQLLTKLIRAELQLKDIQSGRTSTIKEAANLFAGMLYANIRRMTMLPGIVSFLAGGVDKYGYHLYDLGVDGSVMKIEDFASDGSGSVFALGVLETLYKKGMNVDEGIKLAVKSINAALQRDTASGGGIDIVTITTKGAKQVLEKEITFKLEV